MSYTTVLAGLTERFKTVEGIVNVLDYVPTAIHDTPTLFSMPDGGEIRRSGQVKTREYRSSHYLCFLWQDWEQASAELVPYIDSVPEAVEADPHLGGRLTSGYAEINEWEIDFVTVGGVDYIAIRFYSTVIEK